jgi:hypothetical protein
MDPEESECGIDLDATVRTSAANGRHQIPTGRPKTDLRDELPLLHYRI